MSSKDLVSVQRRKSLSNELDLPVEVENEDAPVWLRAVLSELAQLRQDVNALAVSRAKPARRKNERPDPQPPQSKPTRSEGRVEPGLLRKLFD